MKNEHRRGVIYSTEYRRNGEKQLLYFNKYEAMMQSAPIVLSVRPYRTISPPLSYYQSALNVLSVRQ